MILHNYAIIQLCNYTIIDLCNPISPYMCTDIYGTIGPYRLHNLISATDIYRLTIS